jgi:hypothetical protein
MTNEHRGACTLIVEDGAEISAGADLKKSTIGWGGYLTVGAENIAAVLNLWSGRIRLSNGNEGAFDRPNRETAPVRTDLPFRIRIEGNGDAPF